MGISKQARVKQEFGDFQTPADLARQVCRLLWDQGVRPASVVEPTCGIGNVLFAALDQFASVRAALALEISPEYVEQAQALLRTRADAARVEIQQDSVFEADWPALLRDLPDPVLVIGNPPWVTNTQLSKLDSANLPRKANIHNYRGFDTLTGKSNFDISEWILIQILHWLAGRSATLAMLCKTAVARKLLSYGWKHKLNLADVAMYTIDTMHHFGAAVDACLLVCRFIPDSYEPDCRVYNDLTDAAPARTFGYRDGELIADVALYERWKHLRGQSIYRWRSGIKHDCASIMEFTREGSRYRNGLGELVDLETACLFPLLKDSQLANGIIGKTERYMLVTQRHARDDTGRLEASAPKTWQYLQRHGGLLDARASTIYQKRARFAVFGIGDYSFAPWKVAISALYKRLHFQVVGNIKGKPVVLGDTANFIACRSQAEAEYLAGLVNSQPAREFYNSFIFWDVKRPITVDLLGRLNIAALARDLSSEATLAEYVRARSTPEAPVNGGTHSSSSLRKLTLDL